MSSEKSKGGNHGAVVSHSRLPLLDRVFNTISATACGVGTLWIIAVMLLINSDVIGRVLFNTPVRGVPELVSISIVAIVFLQITHTLRKQRFIRSDVIIDRIMDYSPRLGHSVLVIHNLIGAGLLGTIILFYYLSVSQGMGYRGLYWN